MAHQAHIYKLFHLAPRLHITLVYI
jgi:hypothetical protein